MYTRHLNISVRGRVQVEKSPVAILTYEYELTATFLYETAKLPPVLWRPRNRMWNFCEKYRKEKKAPFSLSDAMCFGPVDVHRNVLLG